MRRDLPGAPPQVEGSFGMNTPITSGFPPQSKQKSPGHGFLRSSMIIFPRLQEVTSAIDTIGKGTVKVALYPFFHPSQPGFQERSVDVCRHFFLEGAHCPVSSIRAASSPSRFASASRSSASCLANAAAWSCRSALLRSSSRGVIN